MARLALFVYSGIALLSIIVQQSESFAFVAALGIASSVVSIISFLWYVIEKTLTEPVNQIEGSSVPITNVVSITEIRTERDARDFVERMEFITFKTDIDNIANELTKALDSVPELVELQRSWASISLNIGKIDYTFSEFLKYKSRLSKLRNDTLIKFADETLNHYNSGLLNRLLEIYFALSPHHGDINREATTLNLMNKYMKEFKYICKTNKSLQQILADFYEAVVITEAKGYLITQFAYKILEMKHNVVYTEEKKIYEEDFKERFANLVKVFKEYITNASREIWTCDPEVHKKDVTYTTINDIFRNTIIYNHQKYGRYYSKECKYLYFNKAENEDINKETKDIGFTFPYECVESYNCFNTNATICVTNYANEDALNTRRSFNRPENCQDTKIINVGKNHCVCTCNHQNSYNEVYFSTATVYADVENNYIVTGARFRKEYNATTYAPSSELWYIEIQQGQLLENGKVNESTLSWKRNIDNDRMELLNWNNRVFQLVTSDGEDNEVLTGLGFARSFSDKFALRPETRQFNYTTGKLGQVGNLSLNGPYYRKGSILDLSDADIPILSTKSSVPDSLPNHNIVFGPSSFEKDRGQTTIPFIDLQDVVAYPPTPLSGAGLYHKGTKGYGGFVALKLLTYNVAKFI